MLFYKLAIFIFPVMLILCLAHCGTACPLGVTSCNFLTSEAPSSFRFTDQTNVNLNTTVTSNEVVVSGFTSALPAVCTGCTALLRNGVASANSAFVLPGDRLAMKLLSSSTPGAPTSATLVVGGYTAPAWSVTTLATGTPAVFSFTDRTNINLGVPVTSNAVTLSGSFANATATCTGCTGISRNGGAFLATGSGFNPGDTITIRMTSATTFNTATTASVTIASTQSGVWSVTTLGQDPGDVCAGTPTPGTVCADGTVYAGSSPDGNVSMFTTPCDAGLSYDINISACVGTLFSPTWSTMNNLALGLGASITGRLNTQVLYASNGNADGPYPAASYCVGLAFGGHNDWYLPASDELVVLATNRTAIGGFANSAYWSSTEAASSIAVAVDMTNAGLQSRGKTDNYRARCVRRN